MISRFYIVVLSLCLAASLGAQTTYTKVNNTTALDQVASWSPSGSPTISDTVSWAGTYTSGTVSIGSGLSAGTLVSTSSTAITLSVSTGPLTLGSGGMDLAAAAQNFSVNAPVSLAANQTWAVNTSRTLTVAGAVGDSGVARVLTLAGNGTTAFSGPNTFSGGLVVSPPAGGLPTYKFGGNNPASIARLTGGAFPAPITANGRLDITAPIASLGVISGGNSSGLVWNSSTTSQNLTFAGGSSFSMFQVGADNARATLRQSGAGNVTFAFFGYNTAAPNSVHIFDGGTWILGQIGQNNTGAQTSGTFTLTNGADVTVSAQGNYSHGTWRVINGALRFNSSIAVLHGSATGTNTSLVLQVDNSGGGPGLLTATGGLTLADGGSMVNANSLTVGEGGTVLLNGGVTLGSTTARTAETDTVTLAGGKLSASGTLSAAAATTGQTRTFNWTSGQLTAATITPGAGFATPASGGITATALIQTGGTLAPGDIGAPGRTTINGGYTLGAAGTLAIDLAGPAAATAFQQNGASVYDQLVVNNGPVSLAGTLTVSLVGGFVPSSTQSFTLLNNTGTGAGITGAFANIASGSRLVTTDNKGSFLVTVTTTGVSLSDFLYLAPDPVITTQPLPLAAAFGKTGVFSVSVVGRGPFTYQWRKAGVNIPGANTATLLLPNLQASSVANYDVVITNSAGTVTSSAVALTVESAVPGVLRFEMDQTPVATTDGIVNAGGTGNGTMVGSPLPSVVTGARGFTGSAWDFSSKTSWLRVPASTPILRTLGNRQLSNGLTFSFWMNLDYTINSGMDAARLFSFSNGGESYSAYVSKTFLAYGLPNERQSYTWGNLDGGWFHIVIVYDFEKAADNFLFYGKSATSTGNQALRGTLTVAPPALRATNPGDFILGAMGPQGYLWPGKVDQFQVFNRALTITEINQLYTTTGALTQRSPSVSVGASRDVLTWPANSVTVTAYATDDALPTASRNLTRTWSRVSGPGTASFAGSTPTTSPSTLSDSTTVTFSAAGTYVLRCTVSDGSLSQSGDVTVKTLVNTAPIVTAEADRTVVSAAAPARIALTGYTRDDALPNPPGMVVATWSQVSGPASVTFDRTDLLSTFATVPAVVGDYVIRLSGTDGSLTTNADLTLTVTDNFAPTVAIQASAQTLAWPATTATLTGVVTDDGVPGQPSGQWTQLSGPGTVAFASPAALQTTATFPALGQYVLRFTGSDGQKSASTDAYFTVWSPGAPFVNPGSSRAAWLPNATIPLSGSFSGHTTASPTVAWSVLQTPPGVLPGTVSFSAPAALQTNVTFTTKGTYILGLTVTDGAVANTGRLVVQVYDSTVTTATFRNRTVPSGSFGYTRSQLNAFTGDLGLQFDLAGLDWNVIKPAPPVGVHPRLLVNAEDLPDLRARHGIGQPATTTVGPVLLQTIRARCAAELTAPGATWNAEFTQLVNGDTTLYAAIPGDETTYFFGILAYEAWRCLLENDPTAGARVAAAIATACSLDLARMQASTFGYWAGMEGVPGGGTFDNFTNGVHLHFTAYAYDYAHAFMTEAQRSTVRQTLSFATTNQFSVGLDAVPAWAANCSNWIFNSSLYMLASVLAIEGEPGYPADVLPRLAATFDRLYTIGFGPDGAMWEGMGKGQMNAESLVMLGKRGYLAPLSTAARYCVQRQYLHSLETTGYSFTWDEYNPSNGGRNNFAAARYADVPVMKALYPQDPLIDFVLRNEYGGANYLASSRLTTISNNFVYSRADQLIRSALLRDFRTDLTWQQGIDQQVEPAAPLSQLFNSRGLVTARSSWQPDGLRLMFLPRANGGGHAVADRGSIGLSALGRVWIPVTGVNPIAGDTSLAASVPRIADVGPTTVPVKMVQFTDTGGLFVAAADLKDAFSYDSGSASTQPGAIANFITPNSRLLTPRPVGWADVPLSLSNDWQTSIYPARDGAWLVPHTAVQRAYRTLGLVRGARPYALLVDDIQKDTTSRAYLSRLMLEADLTQVTVNGNDALVSAPGSTTSLLVRVVNSATAPVFTRVSPLSVNALDIAVTAVAPDFRVLLFPHVNGTPLPVTSYSGGILTVVLDGRTDRIQIASHADGRSRMTLLAPSAPTGLAATASGTQISLSWNAVADAATYTVKRASVSGGPYTAIASGLSSPSYTDATATPGLTAYYIVTATNLGGGGPASAEINALALTPLQSWRQTHFGTPANTGTAADGYDFEGDGVSNLLEYAFGGTPTVVDRFTPVISVNAQGFAQITFNWVRPDLHYIVQGSSELAIWTDLESYPNATHPTATNQPVTVTDPVGGPRRFLRVKITSP